MCRERLTAVANWLTWWVMNRRYQKFIERMPFLTAAPPGRLRLDGDDGVDEGGGVDQPENLVELLAGAPERRVRQEELFELASPAEGGGHPRRAAAHLLVDLGPDPGEVGPVGVVVRGSRLRRTGSSVTSGASGCVRQT